MDQAKSIRPCNAYVSRTESKHDTSPGTSCPSAIGLALQDLYNKTKGLYVPDEILEEECCMCDAVCEQKCDTNLEHSPVASCPECGEPISFEGGCNICHSCGWSKCD